MFSDSLVEDGSTSEFTSTGDFRVHLAGSFGTGTVMLQQRIKNTFEDIQGTEQTASADYIFNSLSQVGGIYRFDLSGSTTPNIHFTVFGDAQVRSRSD